MVRWVFLDVGNVLLDEDPLTYLQLPPPRRGGPAGPAGAGRSATLLAEREARAGGRVALAGLRGRLGRSSDEAGCAAVWEAAEREVRAGSPSSRRRSPARPR